MAAERFRLDQWLWYARFYKSRTLAAAQVSSGKVRVNGQPVTRPAHALRVGDVLTFAQGGQIRVVRVLATARRRGPASEARELYGELVAGDAALRPLA